MEKSGSRAENTCDTYFKIVGDFEPDLVTARLGLQPVLSWNIGDLRRNGTKYDFALGKIGLCDQYDVVVANQMRKTIQPLRDKLDLLLEIRKENNVSFYLEIVPTIYVGEPTPCLAPPMDVIDFCHKTRTQIDIDLYVCHKTASDQG